MENIVDKIKNKKKIYRIILMSLSILISALVYNLFLLPLDLVTGSTSGIATITNYVYHINPAFMIFLLSLACGIFSLMYVGIKRTIGTLIASLIYPLLVQLTSPLATLLNPSNEDMLFVVILAGILTGISNGLMYKTGYSNGGFPVISQVLYEKLNISIAKSSLIINIIIVFIGGLFFGSIKVMYAIIFLYVNDLVMNKTLLGTNNNKTFYIVTTKEEETKEYLINTLKHNITVFDVKGGIFEHNKKVILSVVPTKEYYKVTNGIKEIDNKAFFIVTDSYQVKGAK